VAAGDFDNDGFDDLAVGAPDRSVGGAVVAGSVGVLYGSNGGLTTARGQLFTQVGGADEEGDGSASPWPPATSTTTGSPTWPPGPPARTSAPGPAPGRSASSTGRPAA
jgi:hypothetical protein